MVRYCAVYGCLESSYSNKDRKFFRFPSDEQRCKHWIKIVGRMDLEQKPAAKLHSSYFVCDIHFSDCDRTTRVLKKNVVPCLFLPPIQELQLDRSKNSYTTSSYTQTDNSLLCPCSESLIPSKILNLSKSTQTPNILAEHSQGKRKLELNLNYEVKKQKLLDTTIENTKEANMSPMLKKIMDAQKILKRKSQGNRYDKEYIMFALNIYHASLVAYRLLSEIISLPNVRTLQRHIAFNVSTKFNENIKKSLQSKCRNMSKSDRYCILCADEISLKRYLRYQINKDKVVGFHEIDEQQSKEIASQAFVVMARGIFSNWEQPLAYCFLGKSKDYAELNTWLENLISTVIEIGFNVCAFTTDQGSKFLRMAKNKSISPDQPFFYVKNKKIYYIFDVPRLTKSLRDSLINYDFAYKDNNGSQQVASWNDIESMYDIEKNKKYKIAFKLTQSHIRPNTFEKTQIKYATQVLSRTVAVSINTLVEEGKLNEKSLGTTKFIELINNTFDILNSSTVSIDYKYKKAFQHAKYQTNTLEKAYHMFSELRVINRNNGIDVTTSIKFIEGFLTSIKAISCLASDLKTAGYDSLFTRRLNQDALENSFRKVRLQGGNCCKPTTIQFSAAFKKLFYAKMIRCTKYANCAEDLDQLLMSIQETQSSSTLEENVSIMSSKTSLHVGTNDYRFELPEENAFTYVCEYLFKKCLNRHKDCEIMENTSINPPENFKQYIKEINKICEDHFENCNFSSVGNDIMNKINEVEFNLPCPCFPLEFLNKLFVRFRIFNVIRHNNRNFRNKSFKGIYFSVCNL